MGYEGLIGLGEAFKGFADGYEKAEDKKVKRMEVEAKMAADKSAKDRQATLDDRARKDKEFDDRFKVRSAGFKIPVLADGQSIHDVDTSTLGIDKEYFRAKAEADPLANALKETMLSGKKIENEEKIKPKENEFKAAGFAKRMESANQNLETLLGKGFDPTTLKVQAQEAAPGIFENAKESDVKTYQQAKRNFISSILRKESGAAIGKGEMAEAEKNYFPQSGDTNDVLASKAQARAQAIANLKTEAGRAYGLIPTAPTPNGLMKGSGLLNTGKMPATDPAKAAKLQRLQELEAKAAGQ